MDKIQEIMGLVDSYGHAVVALDNAKSNGDIQKALAVADSAYKAIESALRELVDRKDLHADIMNLALDKACIDELGINERLAYKRGHKDARHAAAEIVVAIGA